MPNGEPSTVRNEGFYAKRLTLNGPNEGFYAKRLTEGFYAQRPTSTFQTKDSVPNG
jgi:hypothetical protein